MSHRIQAGTMRLDMRASPATTDGAGFFSVPLPASGTFTIRVKVAGFGEEAINSI